MDSDNYDCINSSTDDIKNEQIEEKEDINKFTEYNNNYKYIEKYKKSSKKNLFIDENFQMHIK